ncbi:MAG TPA: aminoacetone oxidase family FAD-binding enzyme, partial [Saprospiraceae bacterium]|nr:aminoacetone oxidase family FAD-binding enzyme [Saprospiraceae bacterium]
MNTKNRPDIAIVGGGAAALMLAAQLDTNQYQVTIYEKNKTPGRKLLVAGNGGFNLTHGRNIEEMIHEYYPSDFLSECLQNFSNLHLREYLLTLGIPTYIGSSNRIFPQKGIKPIEVLNAFTTKIHANKVTIKTAFHWKGFQKDGQLLFEHNGKLSTVQSDYVIFALGGASWSKTGSKGDWLPYFEQRKIKTQPFQASNCAFQVDWSKDLLSKIEGQPLKNIALFCADQRRRGELMITAFGLEGSPIYAHSRCLRQQLKNSSKPQLFLDLKPDL